MKISLSMMLKNEGKTVYEVITRVLPLIDSAVIGIDKGTTDNTRERVNDAFKGSHVLVEFVDFEFKDNFAEIRNDLISRCTGDYVLVLDGHDLLTEQSVEFLRILKENHKLNLDIYDFNVVQRKPDGGETWFQQPRLFKPHIRYDFAIHNTIIQTERRATIPQVVIFHEQPFERYQARKEQRAEINVKQLIKEAYKGDTRSKFYIAQTLFEQGEFEEAARWYRDYIQYSSFIAERYQARLYLAKCYEKLGDKETAISTLKSCFTDDEPRNEHLIALGDIYFERQDYQTALYYYRMAETVSMPTTFLMVEKEYYTWLPNYKQLQVYLAMNDIDNTLRQCDIGEQKAPRLDVWSRVREQVKAKLLKLNLEKRGMIYFVASNVHFLEPIINELRKYYAVRFESEFNPRHAEVADVIWCDWGDYNAVAVSRYKTNAKKILRIHSYEAYSPFMNSIDLEAFDKIVFVAQHTAHYLFNRLGLFGSADIRSKTVIIPNGIDIDKFTIDNNKKKTNKIAFAGNLKTGKGVQLLLQIAYAFPEYELHVAGKFYELDLQEYFYKNVPDNVKTYAWQNDLNGFFKDKSYILSCSVRESNHLTVMQGMAAGLMPLVHSWVGAEKLYPEQYVWRSLEDLRKILMREKYEPYAYRLYIQKNFNVKNSLHQIKEMIEEMIIARDKEDNHALHRLSVG